MTRSAFHLVLWIAGLGTATGAFVMTYGHGPGCPKDAAFSQESKTLRGQYQASRQVLADLLADPNATTEEIQAQALIVIEASDAMVRCVALGVSASRDYAADRPCQDLVGPCLKAMCGGAGDEACQGRGPAKTCPCGRRCSGIDMELGLSPDQTGLIEQMDPNFPVESEDMASVVREAHLRLQESMSDPLVNSPVLAQKLDQYLDARARLEQRTIGHVVIIRSALNRQQTLQLAGLCCPGRGGRGFRGGRTVTLH